MFKKILLGLTLLGTLAACASSDVYDNPLVESAHVNDQTRAGKILASLPAPAQKIPVVIYDFQDQTGQFKNNGNYTEYSSAVTKGGYSILINALLSAGNKKWFTVIERNGLKNLAQERQIITLTRKEYKAKDGSSLPNLPPMLYGAVLIEGGIIGYDSNILTGGAGAGYLGISGSTQYHRDLVSVYLRAINVQNGEVLASVTSSKTIFSVLVDANFLKYFSVDHLFQAEAGFSVSEPTQLAVRQAVETAVYSLIMEGAQSGLWHFSNPAHGREALSEYLELKGESLPVAPREAPVPQGISKDNEPMDVPPEPSDND